MITSSKQIHTAASTLADSAAAAAAVAQGLGPATAKLVVFFASSKHDLPAIARALQAAQPQATMLGCTTAGEFITEAGCLGSSLVAMALGAELVVRAEAVLHRDLKATAGAMGDTLRTLAAKLGHDARALDPARYVGLVLPDGLSLQEETLMDALGDAAPELFVVGGSAGDDLQFAATHVVVNGEVATDAAALALLELAVPYEVVKSSHFVPTARTFTATRVDEATRTVYEFDGRPAAEAYAAALGVQIEQIDIPLMAANPIGLVIGDDTFVRSFQKTNPDGSMVLYSNVLEGSIVTLMRAGDLVETTRQAIQQTSDKLGGMQGALVFNCILRWVEGESRVCNPVVFQEFAERAIPAIGFQTYGEQYLGHVNQTVTMLCFGR